MLTPANFTQNRETRRERERLIPSRRSEANAATRKLGLPGWVLLQEKALDVYIGLAS